MEAAAAAMLEAGVGRFSRAPAMAAALLAEMWAPLAVALAALATLPSLLRRLQGIVLRIRSRGREVIQSHISTYYSSGDDESDSGGEEESSDEAATSSSGEEEEEDDDDDGGEIRRIGFYEGADAGGGFPWGGAVVRTWQGLPRHFPGCGVSAARLPPTGAAPAVRLWGATTASGEPVWRWGADHGGGSGPAAAAADEVVVGWRRDHAASRRRRRAPHAPPAR